MRPICFLSIWTLTAQAFSVSDAEADDSTQFLKLEFTQGVLFGMGGRVATDELSECSDVDPLSYTEIVEAFEDFEVGTAPRLYEGVQKMGNLLQEFTVSLRPCQFILSDTHIDSIIRAVEEFANPVSFSVRDGQIEINGQNIFSGIATALQEWNARDHRAAGEQIGRAVVKVAPIESSAIRIPELTLDVDDGSSGQNPSRARNVSIASYLLVKGVMVGFGKNEFPGFEDCVTSEHSQRIFDAFRLPMEEDSDNGSIFRFFTTFIPFWRRTEYVRSIVRMVKDIGTALQVIAHASRDCEEFGNDTGEFTNAVAAYTSPVSGGVHVGRNILFNGVDIKEDLVGSVDAWKAQDYYQTGEHVGRMLSNTFGSGQRF